MATEYPYEHADVKPERIIVALTVYKRGLAVVEYTYNWEITGDEVSGYDFYTRTLRTAFDPDTADLATIVAGIRAEYEAFAIAWAKGNVTRAAVASWIGYVILE